MNARRSFFKNLIGASAVAAATASTALANPEPVRETPRVTLPDTVTFGEWRLDWSGWKEENCSDNTYGRWTAKPLSYEADGNITKGTWGFHRLYATTGGGLYVYHLGDIFVHIQVHGEPWILTHSPKDLKEEQRVKTFNKLTAFLRENPLAHSENCFRCGPVEKSEENFSKYGYGY